MDPCPRIRNSELRIRIQEAHYLRIHWIQIWYTDNSEERFPGASLNVLPKV
jgi:hypothetical protein